MKSNNIEINDIVFQLVTIRREYEKIKSSKLKNELKKIQGLCIEKLEYLVDARTRRYRNFANYEDLRQDARIALYSALHSYNPEKGDFFWWANKYMKTKVSREANRHSTIKIPLKHARNIQPYKVSQIPIMIDDNPSASDNFSTCENSIIIKNAVLKLPEEQRRVIELHYEMTNDRCNLNSIDKICGQLKITRVICLKLLNEAKRKLKQELIGLEI
jgi:RNA polymerase sigma factor (sigma-70 family)